MVYTPATKHANGVRLLSLDGGGVRGVLALEVLHEVMERIRIKKGLPEDQPCRPADYFELAAGTSTGGIIGIMLFRLRMTAKEASDQYGLIAEQIFSPKVYGRSISWMPKIISGIVNNSKTLVQSARFDDASLKKAVDDVVAVYGLDENDRRLKGGAPLQHEKAGRVSETVLLRSYKDNNIYTSSKTNNIMATHSQNVTISLATCATSAAPTYFPEVVFPEGTPKTEDYKRLVFWDGGLLNNNPIDQLWYSRYELTKPEEPPPAVSCIVSLGTGYLKPGVPSDSWFKLAGIAAQVMDFSTNTNAKAKDFTRHINTLNMRGEHKSTLYVRLNPGLGKSEIGLAEYDKIPELRAIAQTYIKDRRNQEWIDKAVDAICA
ncbi:hypothetical protein FGRMN_2842 [Fusarium graminum]|nr:hypothetical protein FGRMN_2842 [Fusarium graminum]